MPEHRQMSDKLQLFSGFSYLIATCICSGFASNVLKNSASASYAPNSTFYRLRLLKASHADAMLISS